MKTLSLQRSAAGRLRTFVAAASLALLSGQAASTMPFGQPAPADTGDYPSYLFIKNPDCSSGTAAGDLKAANFDCQFFKYTDYREPQGLTESYDPTVANNPQEFFGIRGAATNKAWAVSTGRPDVVLAVMDSGIQWQDKRPDLVNKYFINRGELPMPQGGPNKNDHRFGGYDVNGDGAFNMADYANDSRVQDLNHNGQIDPEDLILTFSDGKDDDHNGYVDDIAGWDFFENDNDPQDEVRYGHGTGEAGDSSAEVPLNNGSQCPNCMVMSLRVGDSFVADVNHFAEAVVYATDMGVKVIQEAEGDINHTSFAQVALDYAYHHGVMINASEADENAGHHMWPAAYEHTMVVNSVHASNVAPAARPYSYLYFNACTNFGGYTYVSVPTDSCSSEATGRSSGISGLAQSAALNAVERGQMTRALDAAGKPMLWALSTEELRQLWRLGADDIDFSSPCPGPHAFCNQAPSGVTATASPNNYTTTIPGAQRYQTVKGWDFFTGYGRANNGRMLRYLGLQGVAGVPDQIEGPATLTAQDRIPPEADIESPRWWRQYGYRADKTLLLPDDPLMPGMLVVKGSAAANRVTAAGGTFDYVLEWAPQVQGLDYVAAAGADMSATGSAEKSNGPWYTIHTETGLSKAVSGELGRISIADVAAKQASSTNPFNAVSDPTSPYFAELADIRLRLRVIAHPKNTADTINNEAVFQKQVDVYAASETILRDDLGVRGLPTDGGGSPSFHDIDGDGKDELIFFTGDGLVHAYTDVAKGLELPGWPVHSLPLSTPGLHGPGTVGDIHNTGNNAYTRGDVPSDFYSPFLLGAPAVADLDDDGTVEVLAADLEGHLYAWEPDGSLRKGFPVTVNYNFSTETPCGPTNIPKCDDYSGDRKRDPILRRDWGFISSPSVGDIDPATPGLEIVAGANDGHVYVWHADGTPMAGWPVLLRDPTKVATMDATSHYVTHKADAGAQFDTAILRTPAIADIDGDGKLDIISGVDEEYTETPNAALDPAITAAGAALSPGNARVYALWSDGDLHPATAAQKATPHLQDQAYKTGWPVKIAMLITELLPTVGSGVNTQPVIFPGQNGPEVAIASAAGPGYLLNPDGSSALGTDPSSGNAITLADTAKGAASVAKDLPSLVAVGGLAAGSIDGGTHISIAGPGAGIRRALSLAAIDEHSLASEDHLNLWSTLTGQFEPNAPVVVNDLQFLNAPILADVTGDGRAEAVQGTAVGDTVVAGQTSTDANTTRYHTGGWTVNSAAVGSGPVSGTDAAFLYLTTLTREGYLRLYKTSVAVNNSADCTALAEWPEVSHDAHRSGNYSHDGERPYPVRQLAAAVAGNSVGLGFLASGDSRYCGQVKRYEVRSVSEFVAAPSWAAAAPFAMLTGTKAAGAMESVAKAGVAEGRYTLLVRAYDAAGNGSAVRTVQATVGNPPAPVNHAPTIALKAGDGPYTAPASVPLTALNYSDADNDAAANYFFDCGNGQMSAVGGQAAATYACQYAQAGRFTPSVQVSDARGALSAKAATLVTVGDSTTPPTTPPVVQPPVSGGATAEDQQSGRFGGGALGLALLLPLLAAGRRRRA